VRLPAGEDHPDEEIVLAALRSLPGAEATLFFHLLGCRRCAARARIELQPTAAGPGGIRAPARALGIEYDGVLSRREIAVGRMVAEIARRRAAAEWQVAKLEAAPPESHAGLILQAAREDAWATAAVLLELSRAALPGDPPRAEALARLAAVAAAEMDAAGQPVPAAELQSEVACQVAEACRLGGGLERAEEELARAAAHLDDAVDGIGRGQFRAGLARLRRDQRRWDEALALFARAADLFERHGNGLDAAVALGDKGKLELRMWEPAEAWESFELAASLVPRGPVALALGLQRGLALTCALENHIPQAWQILAAASRRFPPEPGSREDLELTLVGGELSESEGDLRGAEQKVAAAFQGFLALGEWHAAAIAGLHVARLLLAAGSTVRLERLMADMTPVFAAPGMSSAVLDALGRFRLAVAGKAARVPLASAVLDYLKVARGNPSLPFDASGIADAVAKLKSR